MLKIFHLFFILNILFISTLLAKELDKVSIQLSGYEEFQFAGYYMAKEKGFYKNMNLDVTIKSFHKGVDTLKEVRESRATYGVGSSSLIVEKSKGADIKLIAAIFQFSPLVLISRKDSNITSIQDFKAKKIMTPSHNIASTSLDAMIRTFGITQDSVKTLKHSHNIESLINRETDIYSAYLYNEPFILKEKNIDITIFNPKDYGLNFYSGLLFTSSDEVNHNRQRTINFRYASIKGWEYAFDNIDETIKLILKNYNPQNKSKEALLYEAYELRKLALNGASALGHIDINRVEKIYNIYNSMGYVTNKIDFNEFIFYEDIYRITNFSKKEREYIKNKKVLTVCVKKNWLPYEGLEDGKFVGISADFLNLYAQKLSIPLKIIKLETQLDSFKYLKAGKCDLKPIISSYSKFLLPYHATQTYFSDKIALITKIEEPFTRNLAHLHNKKLLIAKGFKGIENFIKKKYPHIELERVRDIPTALKLVADAKAYGYIGTALSSSYHIQKHFSTQLKIVNDFESLEFSVGVLNSEPELSSILNKIMNSITEAEKRKIFNKWIAIVIEKDLDYSFVWKLVALFVLILSIILFFLVRQNRLKKRIEALNHTLEDKVAQQVKEIKQSTLMFETIFDTVKDGIAILDLKSNFLLVNKAYENITGFEKEELYKTSCINLTVPAMVEQSKKVLIIMLEKGYYGGYQKQCIVKGGGVIDVKIELILMSNKKSILMVLRDITKELQYKKEQERQNRQLLHQSRLAQMGEMISMIAHQWRQPLNAISLTSNNLKFKLMMDEVDNDFFSQEIDLIDEYSQHLSKTIDDFRGFFKENKEKEMISLEKIVESTLNIVRISLENKNIKIKTAFNCNIEFKTYPNEVKQVLLNIIKNAEDALLENDISSPEITIETLFNEKKMSQTLIIKDNAGGVPYDIIEKIFDPYFSTKLEKDGTGLGLYMSKTIIEEHCGAKLSVYNSTNGAIFKIEFKEI